MSTFSTKDISDLPLDDPLFDDIYERYCEFYDGRVLNPDSKSKWFNGLRRFRTDFPFAKSYCIFNGESVLGYISYFRWSEQKSNNLFIRVPLKFKSESFTNFIAQFLKERIGERSLILKSSFPLIQQSAVKAGMIEGNVIQHFKKELKDFSIPMLEEWASKIPNNVKLEIENYVSDENLEDVAFMMTTYLNDMLRPNMHETFVETAPEIKSFMEFSKKNGNSFIHLILRGEDNKPLGICLGMYSERI